MCPKLWFSKIRSHICHQIKCLRTLRKKYKSHPTDHNLNCIKTAEDNLQNSIQQAKSNFEANLVHNFAFSNDSKIYQHVRNITKSASIPATVFLMIVLPPMTLIKLLCSTGTFTLCSLRVPTPYLYLKTCLLQIIPLTPSISLKTKSTLLYYLLTLQRPLVLMELVLLS